MYTFGSTIHLTRWLTKRCYKLVTLSNDTCENRAAVATKHARRRRQNTAGGARSRCLVFCLISLMNAVADVATAAVQASSDSQQWLGPRPRHPGAVLGPRACGWAGDSSSQSSLTHGHGSYCVSWNPRGLRLQSLDAVERRLIRQMTTTRCQSTASSVAVAAAAAAAAARINWKKALTDFAAVLF